MLEVDVALGARTLIGEVLLASKQAQTFKSLVKKARNSRLFALFGVLVKRNPALPQACRSLSLPRVSVVLLESQ
jgi:hypothetical protein